MEICIHHRSTLSTPVQTYMHYLRAMDGKARGSVQLLVADVALEVLGLLVVDQDLVVVELPVAVPSTAQDDSARGDVLFSAHDASLIPINTSTCTHTR